MTNNEAIIAGKLAKYSKGETLTKEDSDLVNKLRETSAQKQVVRDLVRDQPWEHEDIKDNEVLPPKEMEDKLKKYADASKKVKADSPAHSRLRAKWLTIVVAVAMAAALVIRLHNGTIDKRSPDTDAISGINNTHRTMLYGADGTMIAIDTMANGSQVRLSDSASMKKIDKHSWQLCGLVIGRMVKPFKLEVCDDLSFVNLLYPDQSRVTLELNAVYSWSSYRNSAHPDRMERGKGWFDIAKNSQFPWSIHLPDGSFVGDLATCFEIDATIALAPKVSLVSGAVMIKASKRSVQLRPKEQAIIQNGEPVVSPLAVDTALWIWAKEPLVFNFRNTSLAQAAQTIASYYRVAVSNPKNVQGIHVTANIPTSKGLDFICKRITEIQSTTAYLRTSADSIYITDRKP